MTRLGNMLIGLSLLVCATSVTASGTEYDNLGPRISRPHVYQSPQDYCNSIKALAQKKESTCEYVKVLWPFRYLKEVDAQFLTQHAIEHNIKLDTSWAGRLHALRLYLGQHDNYKFYGKTIPTALAAATWISTLFNVFSPSPIHVPEGTKLVYAVFNRTPCGGEAGPVCPSTLLAESLPKHMVDYHMDGTLGSAFYHTAHIFSPIMTFGLLQAKERNDINYSDLFPISHGYRTIDEALEYLKTQKERHRQKRTGAIVYGLFMSAINVIGYNSTKQILTGTVVGQLQKMSLLEFKARGPHEACAMAISGLHTIWCNTTIPDAYLLKSDIYYAGTKIIQATVMDAMPYMIPTFVFLLQYMMYWLMLL